MNKREEGKKKKKKKKKKGKERKNERKKRIQFILIARDRRFRCPRRANSYDPMRKSIGQIGQILYTRKHCEFTRHWIHFDFGFKIYRDLTKSATFQFGFTCCICLNQASVFFFGRVGGGGEQAIWRIGLPLKKNPGYPLIFITFSATLLKP